MRISYWSSDVCSSDLLRHRWRKRLGQDDADARRARAAAARYRRGAHPRRTAAPRRRWHARAQIDRDRKSDVLGKSVSVRVDLGGRRIYKKTQNYYADCLHMSK